MTIQLLKCTCTQNPLRVLGQWSVVELLVNSRDQSANLIISCMDKPLKAAFDVPAPRVEWAVNPSIPALDSTDFNQRATAAEETGL